MSVRMSRAEAWATIEASHTGVFTTLRADGVPISLPVWFVVLDERVYIGAPSGTKKVARVARDPRASFLVESGERWAELVGVHLTGRAGVVTAPARIEQVVSALEVKYGLYRTARSAMPDATRRRYEVPTTVIEIVPDDRILGWDNRRLALDG